jgi:aryl-alcohol dehydrogenase-like predicted oxidoreductase
MAERNGYEGELAGVVKDEGLSSLPYFALAKGFLTGKYRPKSKVQSARAESARAYLTEKGLRVLAALDEVAAEQIAPVASVALAWLAVQPTVVAPIASARTLSQLAVIMRSAEIHLTVAQLRKLSDASA